MTSRTDRRAARGPGRVAVVIAVAVALVSAACTVNQTPTTTVKLTGRTVRVVAVWSGEEQAHFERVLHAFEQATGARVEYTSAGHDIKAFLDRLLAEGRPPDIAFVPQPGVLEHYARAHRLVAVDRLVRAAVARNYARVWARLGSVDGRLYGVWFKAADKSLVWYDVGAFERVGVVPPDDLDGLVSVAHALVGSGLPAFSVGGADSWTLTDWFENLYLRLAGPQRYDMLAAHRIRWTDESVKQTLRALSSLLAPELVAGGVAGALHTTYEASVEQVFGAVPAAAMVFEGDFVGGLIKANTHAALGVDADVFPFPGAGTSRAIVGGGDAAVLMTHSAAGGDLLRFLAGPQAAAVWATQGGFISPNVNLDLAVYPDEISRSIARSVLDSGDDFHFDLSDLQPADFGSSPDRGLRKELQDFLVSRDVDGTATRLEAEATAAFGG